MTLQGLPLSHEFTIECFVSFSINKYLTQCRCMCSCTVMYSIYLCADSAVWVKCSYKVQPVTGLTPVCTRGVDSLKPEELWQSSCCCHYCVGSVLAQFYFGHDKQRSLTYRSEQSTVWTLFDYFST